MANRLTQVVRSLLEANRSPGMRALDLRASADLRCVNMMCEKVGEACVCRVSRVLEKHGGERWAALREIARAGIVAALQPLLVRGFPLPLGGGAP